MASNLMNYLVLSIFAVIILYYMIYVSMDISNTTSNCESIHFLANDTLTATEHTVLLYPTPLLYNDSACTEEGANYSYEAGGYAIGENIANDTFYAVYDYDTPMTVFSLDLTFMGILVIIGVGILAVMKLIGAI